MFRTIAEFAPEGTEAGIGLALQNDDGRYLFFLAGTRHHRQCCPGELFYAGIGGHREPGEDWLTCARREVKEETGTEVDIVPSAVTWYVPQKGPVRQSEVSDRPQPLGFCEMIHPVDTPRAGRLYRIVIYKAHLRGTPKILMLDEVRSVIALTHGQVIEGPHRKLTLGELLEEGACVVAGQEYVDLRVRLYPLGTASALAHILHHVELEESANAIPQVDRSSPSPQPVQSNEGSG